MPARGSRVGFQENTDVPHRPPRLPRVMKLSLYLVSGNDLIRGVKGPPPRHSALPVGLSTQLGLSCVGPYTRRELWLTDFQCLIICKTTLNKGSWGQWECDTGWMGSGCQQSQGNPASRALTQLAEHNVTAGCWQGSCWTVPPVCPGGRADWPFNFVSFVQSEERKREIF